MYALKIIFKTYWVSLLLTYIYMGFIASIIEQDEMYFMAILLLVLNLIITCVYVIGILIPFQYLFRKYLVTKTLKQAIHSLLIYVAIIPMLLCMILFTIPSIDKNAILHFFLVVFDISAILFTGFIQLLKYKTSA